MHLRTNDGGREACAEQLMSTPVLAVTAEHSLPAAWQAMRERPRHLEPKPRPGPSR